MPTPSLPVGAADEAEAYLMGIAANLNAKGVACTYRVIWGDPDQAILDTIEDEKIDSIVMTTHGRTGDAASVLWQRCQPSVAQRPLPVVIGAQSKAAGGYVKN